MSLKHASQNAAATTAATPHAANPAYTDHQIGGQQHLSSIAWSYQQKQLIQLLLQKQLIQQICVTWLIAIAAMAFE
jgi:hypothetical protein